MSKYLCADCVLREQCDGEWTMRCSKYVSVEHKQTNEEWLHTLTTEQLAEWFALRLNPGILLALRMKYHCTDINAVREWLKEKHD